jgi:hypothetical protein
MPCDMKKPGKYKKMGKEYEDYGNSVVRDSMHKDDAYERRMYEKYKPNYEGKQNHMPEEHITGAMGKKGTKKSHNPY